MITKDTRIGELLKNPIAKDLLGVLGQYASFNENLMKNPLVRALKISTLQSIAKRVVPHDDPVVDTLIAMINQEADTKPVQKSNAHYWWKEAVVYQIYPRSFKDGNGDGVGDLRGIIEKLDYLRDLGVGAIWLSPIYDSPNDDNGYDVRDYRAVMTEFGTMEDAEALIAGAHERGMRIIFDLVVNHTSDEHEWFVDSAKNPDGPHGDYYIWRKPKGTAHPNNWSSFFSGPAWERVDTRDEEYLHLFSRKQPDLNWENPKVRDEVCGVIDFWRQKGVDGFRLDVINYISKTSLEDGSGSLCKLLQFCGIEHYFYGDRLNEYLREIRARAFGDAFTVGETPGTGPEMNKLLTADERKELNTVFSFDHLENPGKTRFDDCRYKLSHLKESFCKLESEYAEYAWPSIFVENHDNPRMVSKVDPREEYRDAVAKLLAVMLLSARGTVFLYQGQELGMVNVPFSGMNELRDIESVNKHRELVASGESPDDAWKAVLCGTRDHSRTPMQWTSGTYAGFSEHEPWIRVGDKDVCNAEDEIADENSVWRAYQSLILLRKEHPALVYGSFEPLERAGKDVFCYYRGDEKERFYIEINLTARRVKQPIVKETMELVFSNYMAQGDGLEPYEANVYRVEQ